MNIGIDIRSLTTPYRTGVGEYTYGLLSALFALDTENTYILFYNAHTDVSAFVPKWEQENVHVIASRVPNKLFHSRLFLTGSPKLDQLVKQKVDVWFSPNLHFTSVSKNAKHILTVHDLSFEHFPDCYSRKGRLWHRAVRPKSQCQRADLILVPSHATKQDIVDTYHIDEKKIQVVYPGITNVEASAEDCDRVRSAYKLPKKFILFLGTMEPRKNLQAVIEAYAKSGLYEKDVLLVIAGAPGWSSDEVLALIKRTNGIRHIGFVDQKDKNALYKLAELFVYPSLYEGFGFPVLEAMQAGTPVITSNRSSLAEIAGGVAYLVNPLSVAELARGFVTLTGHQDLRTELSIGGKQRSVGFLWEEAASSWLSHVEGLRSVELK